MKGMIQKFEIQNFLLFIPFTKGWTKSYKIQKTTVRNSGWARRYEYNVTNVHLGDEGLDPIIMEMIIEVFYVYILHPAFLTLRTRLSTYFTPTRTSRQDTWRKDPPFAGNPWYRVWSPSRPQLLPNASPPAPSHPFRTTFRHVVWRTPRRLEDLAPETLLVPLPSSPESEMHLDTSPASKAWWTKNIITIYTNSSRH